MFSTVLPAHTVQRLGPAAVIVALVGYLESVSMAKAFARQNNYKARSHWLAR